MREARIFLAIAGLAAFLRIIWLDTLPVSLFRDEAEKIMTALSLAERGTDLEGNSWPVFIKVFQVTTSAIYQYCSAILVLLFGVNEWSARLPAAFAGSLTVIMSWFAVRKLYGLHAAILATSLLAISAWHIPLSRWAHQGILVPLFIAVLIWAVAALHKAAHEKQRLPYGAIILGGLCSGLAFYTYDVARLIIPLLGLVAAILWRKILLRNPILFVVATLSFCVAASPALYLLATDQSAAQLRFKFVTIAQPGLTPFEVIMQFVHNYLLHWSPDFLLFNGDKNLRHGAGIGILNPLELVGAVALIYYCIANRHDQFAKFILAGILLYPVASSLTRVDVPHALRSITGIPFFSIAAGIALPFVYDKLSAKLRKVAVLVLALTSIATTVRFFAVYYGPSYRAKSAPYWEHGIDEALQIANTPPLNSVNVVFDNVLGYEYLAPFYLGLDAKETAEFQRHPRFKARFRNPAAMPPADDLVPTIYLTVPGQNWPSHWGAKAIYPNDLGSLPTFFIVMNTPAAHIYNNQNP